MLESLFVKYLNKFMPALQSLITMLNGKRNASLTYLFKQYLRTEFSPDNKWESTSVDTTFVAADFVSMDSPLPLKNRDSIATANGKLPKIGMSRQLKESEITSLNIMEAQGGNQAEIVRRLANDPVACANGIDERNEYNFLSALRNGYVAIKDEDHPNQLLRLNYNYLDENTYPTAVKDVISLEDLYHVIAEAESNGDTITKIWIAKEDYDAVRKSNAAKELVANYEGRVVTNQSILPVPIPSTFDAAFADETGGVQFVKVNRSVIIEANGKRNPVKPWAAGRAVFVTTDNVGTLVYGRLAEQTNPVTGVLYSLVDGYKLIARFRETNPLRETTTGQAFVAPVIENVDQIYILDASLAEEVDETEEAKDTDDEYVTVWGNKYTKSNFITEANKLGAKLAPAATDAQIVTAVNSLSEKKQNDLRANVEQYIVS